MTKSFLPPKGEGKVEELPDKQPAPAHSAHRGEEYQGPSREYLELMGQNPSRPRRAPPVTIKAGEPTLSELKTQWAKEVHGRLDMPTFEQWLAQRDLAKLREGKRQDATSGYLQAEPNTTEESPEDPTSRDSCPACMLGEFDDGGRIQRAHTCEKGVPQQVAALDKALLANIEAVREVEEAKAVIQKSLLQYNVEFPQFEPIDGRPLTEQVRFLVGQYLALHEVLKKICHDKPDVFMDR